MKSPADLVAPLLFNDVTEVCAIGHFLVGASRLAQFSAVDLNIIRDSGTTAAEAEIVNYPLLGYYVVKRTWIAC